MSEDLVIVPSNGDGYVKLARDKTGRLFRKQILSLGNLRHPTTGKQIVVDDTFAQTLKKNFEAGYCDIVQVPLANEKNEHTEDPTRNIGEVVDIEIKDQKIYAILDVRDTAHAEKLGKTYLGASAMMHLDYTDTKTGTKVGPTLLHACVTNRPYLTGLENYEEIVAATDKDQGAAVLLTTDVADVQAPPIEETDMPEENVTPEAEPSLEDLLAALKSKHNIDVPALQAKAADGDTAAALSKTLVDALTAAGVVKLSNNEAPSDEDVVGAVADLAKDNVSLTDRVNRLERQDAEHAVDTLVGEGRVLPAQKPAFVELRLTNPTMFDALVPAEPIVKLNNETGVTPPDDAAHAKNIDTEVARLSALLAK
jgi:hypothetical protein